MSSSATAIAQIQRKIWDGSLPLEIRLASADCKTYDEMDAYMIHVPRLSYLPFLLPRLHAFFQPHLINPTVSPYSAWLSFDSVPLKWHYPVGLLYDLFSNAAPANPDDDSIGGVEGEIEEQSPLPWRLELRYEGFPDERLGRLDGEGKVLWDGFVNGVKEADVIRNGKGNVFMGLSKDDSDALWQAVQDHDLTKFNTINNKLLNPPGIAIRNIPLKIYLPTAPEATVESDTTPRASMRTVQSLIPAYGSDKRTQTTLGEALKSIIPTVFPSPRNPLLAVPVLHGAVVPMKAPMEELMRCASYADGFLHVVVVML